VVESIVPWLSRNASCWSAVELRNLGNREVSAEVEGHRSSGALVPLEGSVGIQVRLKPGAHAQYKVQLPEESSGAWVRVRERVPAPGLSPVLAVSGSTECLAGDELMTTVREVVWPTRDPWFSGEVRPGDDGVIALINAGESAVRVWGCYSRGVMFSVPTEERPGEEMTRVCSEVIEEMVPPFGSREFALARGGNSWFSLRVEGTAVVLQMLRPAGTKVQVYRVDSSITFGAEAGKGVSK
jgi:hypothetical protein